MAITTVDSRDELSDLVDELGVHSKGEEVDDSEDEDVYLNEGEKNFQEVYDALLENCGKYAKVAKNAVKKMKKIEEEHKSTLVQLKDVKCEVKGLKEELTNVYSKIKFLELEIIQVSVKVEHISTKKLDSVLSSLKPSNDRIGLSYTNEGSSNSEPKKEGRFVLAKNVENFKVEKPKVEMPAVVNRTIGPKPKKKGKSLPKSQRGPHVKHFCHHCGVRGHARPNCFKLQTLKRADSLHDQDNSRRMQKGTQAKGENKGQFIGDVMEMLKNISQCLASFTPRFKSYVGRILPSKDLTQNIRTV